MKTIYSIFAMMLLVSGLKAQDSFNANAEVGNLFHTLEHSRVDDTQNTEFNFKPISRYVYLPDSVGRGTKYGFFLGLGYRGWSKEGDNILFDFTDDSPSRDNVQTSIDVTNGSYIIDFGVEFPIVDQIDGSISYEGFTGNIRGGGLALEGIYQFSEKFDAGFRVFSGRNTIDLGDIMNNAVYIQINESEYLGESISVKLRQPLTVISPSLGFKVSRALKVRLGFNLEVLTGNPKLIFNGTIDGEDQQEEKPLDDTNRFLVDGQQFNETPVNFSGFYINLKYYNIMELIGSILGT